LVRAAPFSVDGTATDAAGNQTTFSGSAASIDSMPPAILGGTVSPDMPARRGTTVSVHFTTGEALNREPSVSIGGRPMTKDPASGATDFDYTYEPGTDDDDLSNPKQVVVAVEDDAHNQTVSVLGQVTYDFTPPAESPAGAGIAAWPTLAGIGQNLTVTATFDEPVGMAALSGCNGLYFEGPVISGRRAIWSHVVAPGDAEGPCDAGVSATDLAGNPYIRIAPGVAEVDSSAPEPPSVTLFPPLPLERGAIVAVAFGTAEALPSFPGVSVGGVQMVAGGGTLPASGFAYTHAVAATDTEGTKQVVAVLSDAAGNTTTSVFGQVVYDFSAPAPAVSITPDRTGLNRTLTVQVSAGEPLSTTALPGLTVTSPAGLSASSFAGPMVAGGLATWTHTVTSADPAGSNVLRVGVVVYDQAGNSAAVSSDGSDYVDPTPPTTSDSFVQTGPHMRGAAVSGFFAASEALSGRPSTQYLHFRAPRSGAGPGGNSATWSAPRTRKAPGRCR